MVEEYRKCSKCDNNYPLTKEYFYSNNRNKKGLATICKICASNKEKEYRKNNREKVLEKQGKYRNDNIEKIRIQQKKHEEKKKEIRRKNREELNKIKNEEKLKLCYCCNKTFHLTHEFFGVNKNIKSGFNTYCKECSRKKSKEYSKTERCKQNKIKNRRIINKQSNKYYINNKEKIALKNKINRQNNIENIKAIEKLKRLNNKEKIKEYNKKYYEKNKITEYQKSKIWRKKKILKGIENILENIVKMINRKKEERNITEKSVKILYLD